VATVGSILGRLTGRSLGVLIVRSGPTHFGPLADLCVSGDVRIHIDSTYALENAPQAFQRVGDGEALGKAVVEIS